MNGVKKVLLTLILVSCALNAHAQSSWETDDSVAPDTYTAPEPQNFAPEDEPFSAFDDATAPREARKAKRKRRVVRSQPKPSKPVAKPVVQAKPIAARVTPPRPTPPKAQPSVVTQAPRPASPFMNIDPTVFSMISASTTQAQSGTVELPYNLRVENYDFKRNRVKPNPAFRTPPSLRSPILASFGYYEGQDDEVCSDPLLCAARSYNQTLSAQSQRLAQTSASLALPTRNMSSMNIQEGETLPYAALLASNFKFGLREARRKPMCAKAVRRILENSGLIPKDSPLRPVGAKDYRTFLENFGFRHNPRACNSPGVVRVYDKSSIPQCSRKRKTNCFKGRRTEGDKYGHVEILGKDGNYHHFTKSKRSIQDIFSPARRPLIGCMVKESGSR